MAAKTILSHDDCMERAGYLVKRFPGLQEGGTRIYGVPRGGVPALYLVQFYLAANGVPTHATSDPRAADWIVDDIIDSAATKQRYLKMCPNAYFDALVDKTRIEGDRELGWVVFPWEKGENEDTSANDIVTRLLQYVGEDVTRGGLKETPQRVLKAWKEWTDGYGQKPEESLKLFNDGADRYNEMIWQRDLPFYSHCEHHLAPFFGHATIAYVPDKHVVGLSKISRVLDIFAHRLQVQERITVQVADALMEGLAPRGVGVILRARHLCMESRGISKQGHETVTSALRGVFVESTVRNEFLSLAK